MDHLGVQDLLPEGEPGVDRSGKGAHHLEARRRPRVLHVIPCSDVILADRDIGRVGHVQPDFRFLGRLGDERELEEQVLRRQGDAPGDQVIPVSDLANVEIERVRNPGLRRRGRDAGDRRYLADPWQQGAMS